MFWQLTDERGDVFVLHVGVGVELRTCCWVGGVAIVDEEAELVGRFAIVFVALAVNHKFLGGLEVLQAHEGHFNLVLDIFHAHAVAELELSDNLLQTIVVEGFVD